MKIIYTKKNNEDIEEDDEDSDFDYKIEDGDIEILSLSIEDDVSTLQIWIYEEKEKNLYLHHDILLNSYGLCIEWIGIDVTKKSEKGNFCALGSLEPVIEIWDLDVINPIEPILRLGNLNKKGDTHEAGILGLNWNKKYQNLIASCSEDKTIKLWDIEKSNLISSFDHHNKIVSSVQWHPVEYNILLTGSYDKKASIFDPRSKNKVKFFDCKNEIESVQWDLHKNQIFSCCLDNGYICSFDFRYEKNQLFNFKAHEKSCNEIQYHPSFKDLLVSSSEDGYIKLWNIKDNNPKLLKTQKSNYGAVFTIDFSKSCDGKSFLLGASGNCGKISIYPNFGSII